MRNAGLEEAQGGIKIAGRNTQLLSAWATSAEALTPESLCSAAREATTVRSRELQWRAAPACRN